MRNFLAEVLVVLVFVLPASLFGVSAGRGRPQRIARGAWGGMHIRLDVNANSATIEYDCAHGRIDGPLAVDPRGNFDLKGTYVREHGGPVRKNERSASLPARYTGWTNGKRMKLTVALVNTNESVGTFELTRDGPGRVFKCR